MRFRVHGADEVNGHELAVELNADTVAQARAQAFRMGMLVSRVEALSGPELPHELRTPAQDAPPTSPAEIAPPLRTPTPRALRAYAMISLVGGCLGAVLSVIFAPPVFPWILQLCIKAIAVTAMTIVPGALLIAAHVVSRRNRR